MVSERADPPPKSLGLAGTTVPGALAVLVLGAALAAVGLAGGPGLWPRGLAGSGFLLVLGGLGVLVVLRRRSSAARWTAGMAAAFSDDPKPVVVTDAKGAIRYVNPAAEGGGIEAGQRIADRLDDHFANPPAEVYRLLKRAAAEGAAHAEVLTARARRRITVHRADKGAFVWRLAGSGQASGPGAADAGLPVVTLDENGRIAGVNDAMRRTVGAGNGPIDEVLRRGPPDNGEQREVQTLHGSANFVVARRERDDGGLDLIFIAAPSPPGPARAGGPGRAFGVNDLPVPLMLIDTGGRVVDMNARGARLIDREVAPGSAVSDIFEGLGRSVSDWLEDARGGRAIGRPEVLKVCHPGKEIYLQVTLGKLDPDGEGKDALLAVLNDATELKTLEAQFVQSQKMQAIGQLAGGVAHDFNNLLTAISGHCDLLLLRHDHGDPEYADLVQIHQNANRAASLVGQLLAFSRKQNLQPEVLDLRDTLSDLTHLLNRLVGEKVSLRLSHDPDLASIRADKRQLEQVLMNLVVNARDAMPEGGEIHISTSTIEVTEAIERQRARIPAGEYVIVKVADEGIGIPADKLPKIFEPFFTTKQQGEGTGLGLSTAYGIVKQTGGFIFADSELGRGTTFSLYFPAYRPAPDALPAAARVPAQQVAGAGEGVVLLVEDEAPVRAFASRALRMRGYQVLEAANAEEALETLKDETLEVDVFVTDVIMPGLDGPTWVREALKTRPDTKVIFVSGYAEESFADSQSKIPNSVFLPKPFSLSELANTVMEQTA